MGLLYAAIVLMALIAAQLLLFGMISRRLPALLRALDGDYTPHKNQPPRELRA